MSPADAKKQLETMQFQALMKAAASNADDATQAPAVVALSVALAAIEGDALWQRMYQEALVKLEESQRAHRRAMEAHIADLEALCRRAS